MKKKLIIITAIIFTLILTIGELFVWFIGRPMYQPGMARKCVGATKMPKQDEASRAWQVEKGIKIHHFSAGQGDPVLVLQGGMGVPFEQKWESLSILESEFRFHYYHQRGSGLSTKPIEKFDSGNYYENAKHLESILGLTAQVADIERIRLILGEEKLILVGHSFGAFQAMLYAAEYPERVAALVLVSPAPLVVFPGEQTDIFESVGQKLGAADRAAYEQLVERYLDFGSLFEKNEKQLSALNSEMLGFFSRAYGLESPTAQPQTPAGWQVFSQYLSMGKRHDYTSAIQKYTGPVLVVHGVRDQQSEDAGRSVCTLFQRCSFRIIEQAGHFAFVDTPTEFADIVADFLLNHERP